MELEELIIGAPFTVPFHKKDSTAFQTTPYVVLVNRVSNKYFVGTVNTALSPNYTATFSKTTTANMTPGVHALEIWDSSSMNERYLRKEEYALAVYGACSPGMNDGSPENES